MKTHQSSVAVIGGTPSGIATAVRTAREGCDTILLTYNQNLGGMMAGGLSYTDTLTTKDRAPLLTEFFDAVRDHYVTEYGRDSEQFTFSEDGHIFEPHVAEEIFEEFVGNEANLTVLRGYHPVSAERDGETVTTLTMRSFDGEETMRVAADAFVEATYEGDVAATVGVPYRVGRESRSEFGEQFAGRIYTDLRGDRYYPRAAVGDGDPSAPADRRGPLDVAVSKRGGDLDLRPHPAGLTEIYPQSTGTGDDAIQAYNYRLCLSRDPDNQRLPEKPDGYDRTTYLESLERIEESGLRSSLRLRYLPNEKADMNTADLPGENHDYPEADWTRREEIATRHRRYALGLLYFLQNDEAVPDDIRTEAREWGLATDEFTDNENFPWQLYVREARRIDGRYTFTENDARHAPGLDRAPIHEDAIAIAEYPLDSHACRDVRQTGSQPEGFFYASQVTRPSQVPYRSLLPRGVENLVVPGPLSATHVAWGTIRLEPTWMHIGEAAGFAVSQAVSEGTPPDDLDVDRLQTRLVERGVLCSFFNEFDAGTDESWVPAVQYLGTKGFFGSYDARPTDPLDPQTADIWVEQAAKIASGADFDPTERARELPDAPDADESVTASTFVSSLRDTCDAAGVSDATSELQTDGSASEPLTRGEACSLVYAVLSPEDTEADR